MAEGLGPIRIKGQFKFASLLFLSGRGATSDPVDLLSFSIFLIEKMASILIVV